MTNDAKLGLIAGIAGVLVVAVVYFQKAPAGLAAGSGERAAIAGAVGTTPGGPPAAVGGSVEPKAARLPMPEDR